MLLNLKLCCLMNQLPHSTLNSLVRREKMRYEIGTMTMLVVSHEMNFAQEAVTELFLWITGKSLKRNAQKSFIARK